MEKFQSEAEDKNDSILKYLWNPLNGEESDSLNEQEIFFSDKEKKSDDYQNYLIKNSDIKFSFKYIALPKHKSKVIITAYSNKITRENVTTLRLENSFLSLKLQRKSWRNFVSTLNLRRTKLRTSTLKAMRTYKLKMAWRSAISLTRFLITLNHQFKICTKNH